MCHKKKRVTHNALPFSYVRYFVFDAAYTPVNRFNTAMLPVGYFDDG